MKKRILGYILQAPLILIVILSFFVSIYASVKKIEGINYIISLILGIIIILYFIGFRLINRIELYDF